MAAIECPLLAGLWKIGVSATRAEGANDGLTAKRRCPCSSCVSVFIPVPHLHLGRKSSALRGSTNRCRKCSSRPVCCVVF